MTEPTGAVDTEATETVEQFKARALAMFARVANQQGWNGQFNEEMLGIGFTQDQIDAARDAGKETHVIKLTIRTNRSLDTMYGGIENRAASEARRLFSLNRNDSVEVEYSHTPAAA